MLNMGVDTLGGIDENKDKNFVIQQSIFELKNIEPPTLQDAEDFYNYLLSGTQEDLIKASNLFQALYPEKTSQGLLGPQGRKLLSLKAEKDGVSVVLLIAELQAKRMSRVETAPEQLKVTGYQTLQDYEKDLTVNPYLLKQPESDIVQVNHSGLIERKITFEHNFEKESTGSGIVMDMSGSMSRENIKNLYENICNLYTKEVFGSEPIFSVIYAIDDLEDATSSDLQVLDSMGVYTFSELQEFLYKEGFLVCKGEGEERERKWLEKVPSSGTLEGGYSLHPDMIYRINNNALRSSSGKGVGSTPLYARALDLLTARTPPKNIVLCTDGGSDLSASTMGGEIEGTQDGIFDENNRYLSAIVALAELHDVTITRVPYSTNKKHDAVYAQQRTVFNEVMQRLNDVSDTGTDRNGAFQVVGDGTESIDEAFGSFEGMNTTWDMNLIVDGLVEGDTGVLGFTLKTTGYDGGLIDLNGLDIHRPYMGMQELSGAQVEYAKGSDGRRLVNITGIPKNIQNGNISLYYDHTIEANYIFNNPNQEIEAGVFPEMYSVYDVSGSLVKYYKTFTEQKNFHARTYGYMLGGEYIFSSNVGDKYYTKVPSEYSELAPSLGKTTEGEESVDLGGTTPLFTSFLGTLANILGSEIPKLDLTKENEFRNVLKFNRSRGDLVPHAISTVRKEKPGKQYKDEERNSYKSNVYKSFDALLDTDTLNTAKKSVTLVTDGISTKEWLPKHVRLIGELVGTQQEPGILTQICKKKKWHTI